VIVQTGAAALIVGWLARNRRPAWSWLRFGATHIAVLVVLSLVAAVGRIQADEPLPFATTFAAGWTVERLDGVSSDPRDRDAGVRQRARWNGADGAAVIEITCSWLKRDRRPDTTIELRAAVDSLTNALASQAITLEHDTLRTLRQQPIAWLAVDLRAKDGGGTRFAQTMAMASSDRCLATATLTGSPDAFAQQSGEFAAVLERLRFEPGAPTKSGASR
jgi:hypothetical protein